MKRKCMSRYFPMELFVSTKEMVDTVEMGSLGTIPSEAQIRQAISMLCRRQENEPNKFVYIKFPFGMMNYDGLKTIQAYHESILYKQKIQEEKDWLQSLSKVSSEMGLNLTEITQHFEESVWNSSTSKPIQNLVGDRWLTNFDIDAIFEIINKKYDNVIGFVCKPSEFVYSFAGLQEKVARTMKSETSVARIIVALNIGCENGKYFITDEERTGEHWSLLIIDINNNTAYYGDSLAWPLPTNLLSTVKSNLSVIESDLGIDISRCLQNIVVLQQGCEPFYPLQTCSNMCGVIVVCMSGILSESWDSWVKWKELPLISKPSIYKKQLRITVISWIICNDITTEIFSPVAADSVTDHTQPDMEIEVDCICSSEDDSFESDDKARADHTQPDMEIKVEDDSFESDDKARADHTQPDMEIEVDCICSSEDDSFESDDKARADHTQPDMEIEVDCICSSEDDSFETGDKARAEIISMLPDSFTYKMLRVIQYRDIESFHCTFKLDVDNEENVRKWLAAYNEKTKETMVYESCRNGKGKRVAKKFYLRCQHKQRKTGKHTKSNKTLKTTHKLHNNRNMDCPAQIIATLLSPQKSRNGFGADVVLKHNHNHLVHVADALRFRRMSVDTKEKYYDLFSQGHSPATAHLEYETSLMYCDEPQLIADRNVNPKKSDVYNLFNKWRKCNIGVRTGKKLFTALEKRIYAYSDANSESGGKAVVQRYYKSKGDNGEISQEEPLVLAICTPLMSRVHEYIVQSKELVFIDASSSFEDFNNPLFVISTSSAAGGLPLGVVVTSAESASVIHKGMTMLQELFPTSAFYGAGSPANIMIDDSSAEREGLHRTWPNSCIFLCTFHFLQSIWRWLLNSKHGIDVNERQYLMDLVRTLVYAKTESELKGEYSTFENDSTVKKYKNFSSHMKQFWERRREWAICFRTASTMRGINTNNYAESGIRILKDIVFKRVKAYNLLQLFNFITVTFDLYYKRRLLAVAYNRMDRYISLRYKGLGAPKISEDKIEKSTADSNIYLVQSTFYADRVYEIDTLNWTCTCSIRRTGYPSGEPCKHQHSVANKYKLTAPNLIPYFNSEGRYLHALIAIGPGKVGDKSFYAGMRDLTASSESTTCAEENEQNVQLDNVHDSGQKNLDIAVEIMIQQEKLQDEVISLGNTFIQDVQDRVQQLDTQYLSGLKKFFTVYLDTVAKSEPTCSATPRLASLLHTYFSPSSSVQVAGTRQMKVQPTAIARRRAGIARGSKLAPSGRPPKRSHGEDPNIQNKRGRSDHVKRKQNLRQNELKNQANHFKHGMGH